MTIDGDTIVFKSWPFFFAAVAQDRKTAEVRLLSAQEERELASTPVALQHIRIVNAENPAETITRELSGVFRVGQMLGSEMHLFCWRVGAAA